ncbi:MULTISPECIES: site-specific integrase [Flavobacterium]|uniref:site-specific integrase n=1 Tax=Flavobacterium TaxID=237 RepID=UPI0021155181|nr:MULTISPECIES: site-specific integrase [Flavobacterium]UUF15190.1 site-specific integrase [Flavobacterium panici]
MFTYSKDGITVASWLDNRRKNQKNSYPIKIRVTYKRIRSYYSTGVTLTEEEWKLLPTTRSKELRTVKERIENSFAIVKKSVETLAEKGGFSFDALNLRLSKATGDTVNTAFKAKISNLKKEDRIGSMDMCRTVLNNLEKFNGTNISFETISVEWLKKFEKYLLIDKSYSTVGMHMREIRTIMNEAKKAGVIKDTQYPFGKDKYEIKTAEGQKKALTLQQIGQVVKFSDGNETTERYRDLWFFIYLCNGINVADLVKLKYKNIVDGEICFIRQKTEKTTKTRKEIRVTVTEELKNIIVRWGNNPLPENYIFPYIDGREDAEKRKRITKDLTKRINMRMKSIGNEVGAGNITTYTARHSFATVLKRSGANIAYISESLGHNDLKTTESYLASFEKEERQKNAEMLTNF